MNDIDDEIERISKKLTKKQRERVDEILDEDYEYKAEFNGTTNYWYISIPILNKCFSWAPDLTLAFDIARENLELNIYEDASVNIRTPTPSGRGYEYPFGVVFIHRTGGKFKVFAPLLKDYYLRAEGYTLQQAYDNLERIVADLPGIVKKNDCSQFI